MSALFLIVFASALAAEPPPWLVDDRGLPLTSPVEACFTVELTTHCTLWTPGNPPLEPPAGYSALRIEGEDLAPGSYEVYSASEANEDTILQGLPNGFLGRVELSAGSTAELEVVVSAPE